MTAPTMAEAGSDWVEWAGGKQPVGDMQEVEFQRRDGVTDTANAGWFDWGHNGDHDDVVAYRIVRS